MRPWILAGAKLASYNKRRAAQERNELAPYPASPSRAAHQGQHSTAALRHFNSLIVDDGERFFLQPCFSPVWDTAIGAYALSQCNPADPALRRAADWLLAKEVRRKGDWSAAVTAGSGQQVG